jgi:hypothetical protein
MKSSYGIKDLGALPCQSIEQLPLLLLARLNKLGPHGI